MAANLKVLGQSAPTAGTLTNLYTVPTGAQCVVSTVTVCNTSATTSVKYRIDVAKSGAATSDAQAIFRDVTLQPLSTTAVTIGIALGSGDVLRVRTDLATCSFSAFGQEIS